MNKHVTSKLSLIPVIALLLFLSSSCEKYVDIPRTSSQRLIETAADAQLILNNFNIMNTNYPADGELSSGDFMLDDNGFNNLDQINRDLYIWLPNAVRNAEYWQSTYLTVYYANIAIEAVDKLRGKSNQEELDDIRGQGLFFRSNIFYQMVQLYAKPYNSATANQDAGIPLRLTSDINDKSERGSLNQTYNRIITDLKEAVDKLSPKFTIASRPSKAAAYALMARIYLSMEDYPNALANADAALKINNQLLDYNTLDLTSDVPFPRFNKEVLFHSVIRALQPLDPSNAKIDPSLYLQYNENDLRLKLFFKPNSDDEPVNFRFTGNYDGTSSGSLFNGIATDELYLIRAECYVRGGNVNSALQDLNLLLRSRWRSGTYRDVSTTNADALLSEILVERRKELVLRAQRWTDLRRLNKDERFATTLERIANGVNYTLPPNDLRYILLIPNEVITNSDFTIFQNPR